ncbi:MAG: hypothetical protein KC656_23880, partial [Myxococcales bacterium]|nr:hypothetical protein [Myxococcales bacterium]
GFVQVQAQGVVDGDLIEGERPIFNTVNGSSPWTFRVWRARVGARGSIPKTDQHITYNLLFEAGEVSLTRTSPIVATELQATLSYIPGARIRVGQGKLPVMEEIVQAVAPALETINFSNTLTGLLLENPVKEGVYTGGSYGFRDVGLQVFDGFQSGHVVGSYALMVSNGAGLHASDDDGRFDVSGRAEIGWIPEGEKQTSGRRREIKGGVWWLEGTRDVDGDPTRRMRRGAFVHAEQGKLWALVEAAEGVGMLEAGRATPFGGQVVVAPDGKAWGVVGTTGLRMPVKEDLTFGVKLRFDEFHRRTEDPAALRVLRTSTLGLELNPGPNVRLQVDYEARTMLAPEAPEAARAVAATLGDRVSAQVTARF